MKWVCFLYFYFIYIDILIYEYKLEKYGDWLFYDEKKLRFKKKINDWNFDYFLRFNKNL